VVVIITAAGITSFIIAREILMPQIRSLGILGLQQAADQIEATLGSGIEIINVVAVEQGFESWREEQLRAMFQKVRKNMWDRRQVPLESIFMGFADGRFVSSLERSEIPKDYQPRSQPWFLHALQSSTAVVTPPEISPFTKELVISVTHKAADSQGNFIGVVGFSLPVSAFRSLMQKALVAQYAEQTIVSVFLQDGRYLVRGDESEIGSKLGESGAALHKDMRQAVHEGKIAWGAVGLVKGEWWFGGFRKTRSSGLYVALEMPLYAALWPLYQLAAAYACLGIVSLLLLSLLLVKMARKIVQPLGMLSEAAVRLSRGDYSRHLPVTTSDELGRLTEVFNSMIDGLRQRDFIRDTFGRYVSPEVADKLLETEDGLKLGGENREISIIMSDIRGFTALTSDIAPEKTIHLLNRYLGAMLEILLDHQAIVDEIEGDGILAFFGAPQPMQDHAAQAVSCALAMQSAMDAINSANQAEGLPRLEMAIAINTGKVVVGNIGSERRTKYGAVGAEVNFVGRMESCALGGQILISHSTYEKIKDIVTVRDVIALEFKGIPGPVNLYDVRGLKTTDNLMLPDVAAAPVFLGASIAVQLRYIDHKVVTPIERKGRITHLSEAAAIINSEAVVRPHDEIRLEVLDDDGEVVPGEAFARVVTAADIGNGYEATIRFSFVSPEIRRMFRRRSADR
jgi:class 3 adenylate cyclase